MGRKRKARPATPEDDCMLELDSDGQPIQRNAANARERARMRVLSKAFGHLKTTLPWVPSDTKLSKLDTLRLASCYIAHLRNVLASEDGEPVALPTQCPPPTVNPTRGDSGSTNATTPIHPITLTWPFTFNGKVTAPAPNGESRPKETAAQISVKAEVRTSS